MDAKTFIDDMLAAARRLAAQGRDLAEDKLDVPADGERRDAMLDGMGKGALAAGALALLLGTGAGRRLTGSALKLGGVAAVGALAYKAFQNWQAGDNGTPIDRLDAPAAEARSRLLLDAMILAALADGHVDDDERARISGQLRQLGLDDDVETQIRDNLASPPDVATLAARADSREAAAEVYLVSRLVIDRANPAEQRYLDSLADALGLEPGLRAELEAQLGTN